MRIARLDLIRYGRFTDLSLDLAPGPVEGAPAGDGPDLHILFGPNEAGKSTSLAALEDLLFGIPARSPLNFLHDYAAMRLGAELEGAGERLAVQRRKGNRDTLLDGEGMPLPAGEGALRPFLQGADRAFYARMFSLDHRRLRAGGQEILEARDEVGQMLFAAGAGLGGLRDRLSALNAEADALWGPRRSAKRAYAQAEDRLKAAEAALRDGTVTATDWQKLRDADSAARAAFEALDAQVQALGAERSRLGRIRRVHADIREKAALDATIAALEPAPPLPEDSRPRLQAAVRELEKSADRIQQAEERLAAVRDSHAALVPATALLERAADIRQLRDRRIELRGERSSLPRRRQELAAAEGQLHRLAAELDWPERELDAVLARIPPRPKLAALRSLLARRGGLEAGLAGARNAAAEARAKRAEAEHALAETPVPADTAALAAQIRTLRGGGDPAARIEALEARLAEAGAAIARGLDGLDPAMPDLAALTAIAPPERASVQRWRDRSLDLARRRHDAAGRRRAGEAELARHRKAAERIRRTEHAVSAEELAEARAARDTGWAALRGGLASGRAVPPADLDGHAAAIAAADAVADDRFAHAEAAARLAVTARAIAEQEEALATLAASEESALSAEAAELDAEWRQLWSALPDLPDAGAAAHRADRMLAWLDARAELIEAAAGRGTAERELDALRRDSAAAGAALLDAMAACGEDIAPWRGKSLRLLLEAAGACQQRHERAAEQRQQQVDELRAAERQLDRRQQDLAAAERDWASWQAAWDEAAAAIGLDGDGAPDAMDARITALEEMREIAIPAEALRHDRIAKIERDIAAFEAEAASLAGALLPAPADRDEVDPETVVLEMARQLEAAEEIAGRRADRARDIAAEEARLADEQAARAAAQEAIDDLRRQAGAADLDGLWAAIGRAEALREARQAQAAVLAALAAAGDGLSPADLEAECAGADIDAVKARDDALAGELAAVDGQRLEARDALTTAHAAFAAVGGADLAARAAADREAALAEMQEVAETYVQAKSAALLLDWAIDRYRQEKQAPLLARASGHFAMLTGGSFSELALEFGGDDSLLLTGRRPDGARVGIDGMSDGTADQLYLALRVAAVEDYLEKAAPLPFIADDLFIHFDDARAEAGFRVLGTLAMRTQVLVFTHHRHLVDVARAALGPDLHCLSLADGKAMAP